jgi:UDP-N-acetyl-D-mannosaminuronic acid dehydrogenase
VACLGLAFKADIDDLRESPALLITETLAAELPGTRVLAVEPHVDALPPTLAARPNVELVATGPAIAEADVVVLLVDHAAFRSISLGDLRGRELVDTRGLWR